MFKKLATVLLACFLGLSVGACTEITEYFVTGDPADVSSCAYVLEDEELGEILELAPGDTLSDVEGALCVECNSDGTATAKDSYCGTELSVRCNSDLGYPIYGIAIGSVVDGEVFTGSSWEDEDDTGDDVLFCHNQSVGGYGKSAWKCTNALQGNGKDATTFEVEIKYDASKNTCS